MKRTLITTNVISPTIELVLHKDKEIALNKMDSVDMNWDINDTNDLDHLHGDSFGISKYTPMNTTLTSINKDPPSFVGTYILFLVNISYTYTKIF